MQEHNISYWRVQAKAGQRAATYYRRKLDEKQAIAATLRAELDSLLVDCERVVQWFKDHGQKLPMDSAPDCVRRLDEAIAKSRGRG